MREGMTGRSTWRQSTPRLPGFAADPAAGFEEDSQGGTMRILIYGAGVIGSIYGALLAEAGLNVTLYARGRRADALRSHGLLYRKGGTVKAARVSVLTTLADGDRYDFIFLTVRENQLLQALAELKSNSSPTIVTMVNSLDTYDKWEAVCGRGRILPAFPGAGGGFNGDVLDAALTPRLIQPTTIGKTDGREAKLAEVMRKAGIPCQVVPDMHAWQICHLGMVVPIADAYYASEDPEHAGNDPRLMKKTASQISDNLEALRELGIKLSPARINVFRILPSWLTAVALGFVFRSRFGDRFMYRHSMKAPDEMRRLHDAFYAYITRRPEN